MWHALKKLRQDDCEFEAILGYPTRALLKGGGKPSEVCICGCRYL